MLTKVQQPVTMNTRNVSLAAHTEPRCLHQLVELQAAQNPDALALTYEGQHLSYRELNEQANRLAHLLQRHGVGPDSLVGLLLERSPSLVVGILGILKAGGAYVPLDPYYPAERLRFLFEDTGISLLVTQQSLAEKAASYDLTTICLDSDTTALAQESTANPTSGVTPAHLAYVIYTSGSTGTPKGVQVEHAQVVRLFTATDAWFQFNEHDVWTLFHTFTFDFSVWELWGALLYGGRLVIVPLWVARAPLDFYRLLSSEQVTVLNQTPSAFYQLIRAEEQEPAHPLALRYVIFGGEALHVHQLTPWFERHGDQHPQLVNMYGITETTVHVTYSPLSLRDTRSSLQGGSPIGRCIPDLVAYVLDEHQQPVVAGTPGELYVGGAGVARGYLNRPELTSERFLQDPFCEEPGQRMYRSGDQVRVAEDGSLVYLGRIDHQVKIRGFRIEPGEIESVLSQHPVVCETVVLAREDDLTGDRRLVAYVVAERSGPPDGSSCQPASLVGTLRQYVQQRLPEYMVPSAFVLMDAFPLTPNGKIDRQLLPAPGRGHMHQEYVPPQTPTEEAVAAIWAEVLGLERVGRNDHFVELGGHSLLATQVILRIRARWQREVSLRRMFESPTVASLAEHIETICWTAEHFQSAPLHAEEGREEGEI